MPENIVDVEDAYVLIPDAFHGITVVAISDLLASIAGHDTLDEAIEDAGFEMSADSAQIPEIIARVRHLNETGNIDEFWGINNA